VATGLGLDVFQPASLRDDAVVERLRAAKPDVFVVAAYGKIIPSRILDLAARGSLNVHASLLPRWRGASPINAAILAGDAETGVSIMEVVRRMDAGPVVASRSTPIAPDDTAASLDARLSALGAELLVETLPAWYDRAIQPVPQDEDAATYCSLMAKSDGQLRAAMTVAEAERAVRAYDPWPGAFVLYRDQRLAIWKASVSRGEQALGEPGTLSVVDRKPAIAFPEGLLILDEVQRQGARRVTGDSFLNGERAALPEGVGLA
jgi:methionyl-tRNA formyltransferase